jgi:Zn-dependent M28 family amino/carboxypeptidase
MEEYYAHGSYTYVERAQSLGEKIVAVLNLDMIGWNSEFQPEPALPLVVRQAEGP